MLSALGTCIARGTIAAALTLALGVGGAGAADATPTHKKAIWGPACVEGKSQFPVYKDLGVGIYQIQLLWNEIAPSRPAHPRDPNDPAYRWPDEVDFAVREAPRYGIHVSLQVIYAPPWANGGRSRVWAPAPGAFADFVTAAARRYGSVRHWMIWGEPSRRDHFQPLPVNGARGPRIYSRLLDAAYERLKKVSRRNLVIGGNTFTVGDVAPLKFIRSMRLPSGRAPRMDMYGHNPFTRRRPDLRRRQLGFGYADFSDLDTLGSWIDRYLGRVHGRRIPLFVSEFTAPTDHANRTFNFYVSRATQASWLSAALRIARRWPRLYSLGWFTLYDQPPNGPGGTPGNETNWGLLDWQGNPKPAYRAYRRG